MEGLAFWWPMGPDAGLTESETKKPLRIFKFLEPAFYLPHLDWTGMDWSGLVPGSGWDWVQNFLGIITGIDGFNVD